MSTFGSAEFERRLASKNYFEVLGLHDEAADEAAVKAAFRRLAMVHHPDKATYNKEQAKKRFQEIAEAYEVLTNPTFRRKYLQLRQQRKDSSADGWMDKQPSTTSTTGSQSRKASDFSLGAMRRASFNAARQEREKQDRREQEWQEFLRDQKAQQEQYDALKGSVRSKLLEEFRNAAAENVLDWDSWLQQQVHSKWLGAAWEEFLPGMCTEATADGLQAAVVRDVKRDIEREQAIRRAKMGYQADEAEALPVRNTSSGGPAPKRRSDRPEAEAPELLAAIPPAAQELLEKGSAGEASQRMDYIALHTKLVEAGFEVNEAEVAARKTDTLKEAIEFIMMRR
eukprot:TRINITY_DN40579_c0_g1_i1.p1 TRINITY_DN40579_c0_g1~~TRINITY_DN40579_c0_g1_i1.p1  ORF type:complete len:340 (+),score=111.82 TRINITY_DN40579_c0_g1_i1:85-1104(+)